MNECWSDRIRGYPVVVISSFKPTDRMIRDDGNYVVPSTVSNLIT